MKFVKKFNDFTNYYIIQKSKDNIVDESFEVSIIVEKLLKYRAVYLQGAHKIPNLIKLISEINFELIRKWPQ